MRIGLVIAIALAACAAPPDQADLLVGTARKPLVLVGQQTEELPVADYLSSVGGATFNSTPPTGAGDIEVTTVNGGPISVTPSITFAHLQAPFGTVNLSTLGTIDWITFIQSGGYTKGTLASIRSVVNLHAKVNPEQPSLYTTLQAFGNVSYLANVTSGAAVFQSNAVDDQTTSALSATTNQYMFYFDTSAAGWGWRMQVPANTSQRVLRIYTNVAQCLVTTTARLTFTGTTASDTFDTSNANVDVLEMITFTGGDAADQLYVTQVCTTNHGTTGQIGFAAVSLGTI